MSGTRKRRVKPTAPRKKIRYMWQFQEAIAPLIDEWQDGMVPFPKNVSHYMGRTCYGEIDFFDVLQAVGVMVACLNLGGGSGLYEVIATLLMDEPMRDKIEALLEAERKNGWKQPSCGSVARKNPVLGNGGAPKTRTKGTLPPHRSVPSASVNTEALASLEAGWEIYKKPALSQETTAGADAEERP